MGIIHFQQEVKPNPDAFRPPPYSKPGWILVEAEPIPEIPEILNRTVRAWSGPG